MWERIAILIGGYGFIVLSYAWIWIIGVNMSQCLSAERMDRPTKADAKTLAGMWAMWTVVWATMTAFDFQHMFAQ